MFLSPTYHYKRRNKMGKFDGILICTDLDGTLLRKDKSVSSENIEAIEYFKKEGGKFTFITGRMPYTSIKIYEKVKPNAPIGCINGGGVFDFERDEYLWIQTLPEEAFELVKYIESEIPDIGVQINTSRTIYFTKDNPAMVRFRELTGAPFVTCRYDEIKEPVAKMIFAHLEDEKVLKVAELLSRHPKASMFGFIRSERTLYEILPKGTSKATALLKLSEILDINKTVAIGDYNNDVTMLKAAKVGVAVENACPEAKAVADVITVNHVDHAIAKIIQYIDSEKIKF